MTEPTKGRRACVFCGRTDQKISGEHVWPAWLGELLVEQLAQTSWVITRNGATRTTSAFDARVSVVCKPCNEGWMSNLEGRVRPILTPMILGESPALPLSASDQETLAFWAVKSALVADHFAPARTFWPELFRDLHSSKRPSIDTIVWTAACTGPPLMLSTKVIDAEVSLAADYTRDGVLVPTAPRRRKFGVRCTMQLHHAVLQVLIHRGAGGPVVSPNSDADHFSQIWPVKKDSILWPPHRAALDPAALAAFTDRRIAIMMP
jgi:hypothetical protein